MHAPDLVALGHFLMEDAAPGCHPLNVAGGDRAVVAEAVAVLDRPGKDVRDRLDPAMGVPGEARQVIRRQVIAKIVEQQKRIEVGRVAESKRAAQVHAGSFDRRLGLDQPLDGSNRHRGLLLQKVIGP